MLYEYQAAVHTEAPAERLRQLVERLRTASCEVRFDRTSRRLLLRVHDSEDAWMQTATVTMLLLSYSDVVKWGGHSRRVDDARAVLELPSSAEGPLQA